MRTFSVFCLLVSLLACKATKHPNTELKSYPIDKFLVAKISNAIEYMSDEQDLKTHLDVEQLSFVLYEYYLPVNLLSYKGFLWDKKYRFIEHKEQWADSIKTLNTKNQELFTRAVLSDDEPQRLYKLSEDVIQLSSSYIEGNSIYMAVSQPVEDVLVIHLSSLESNPNKSWSWRNVTGLMYNTSYIFLFDGTRIKEAYLRVVER